jgi:hypothetical protein
VRHDSVGVDEGAKLSEASLAYAAHEHDVLRPSEWAVALALLDYARGERGADTWKFLQLFARSSVNRDGCGEFGASGNLRDRASGAAWQFDASRGGGRRRAAQDDTAQTIL